MNDDVLRLAAVLNGREYLHEMMAYERQEAKEAGLVVVYGYSDDNVEFDGAIDDEVGVWENGTIYLTERGILREPDCDPEFRRCPYYEEAKRKAAKIVAHYGGVWEFETEIPHATFGIYEDGELFCKGIVFDVNDLKEA